MNAKAVTTAVITFTIAVVLFSSLLVPIIGNASTTTTSIENEGASWMRYDMKNSIVGTDISVTEDSGNITITNGTDSQSNELSDALIIYAGSNGSVYYDGTNMIVLSKNNDATAYGTLTGSFTVKEINGSVIASDGTNTYDLGTPAWAYVPSSVGQYAMFNDTGIEIEGEPVASISQTYAGVSAYNDIINMDIGLMMDVTMDENVVESIKWIVRPVEPLPELTPIDPERITIQPLDPSIIDLIDLGGGGMTIMAVPTPTYTDGDWGYDLITDGYDTTVAKIVSYSGAGGGAITIPATVGGYDVKEVGKGGASQTVFDTSLVATNLTIPNGVVKINNNAFRSCSGFTGSLVIPDGVTSIGNNAFNGCSGLTGSLVIPDGVTSIGSSAFNGCSGFTSLIISMEQGGTINSNSFGNTTNLKEVLNLGSLELTTTSYGLNADSVQDHLDAIGFIAPANVKEVVRNEGAVWDLLAVIPLFIAILLVIGIVTLIAWRR